MVVCVAGGCHWVGPRTRQQVAYLWLFDVLFDVCDITIPLRRNRELGREVLSGVSARHDGRWWVDVCSCDTSSRMPIFCTFEA